MFNSFGLFMVQIDLTPEGLKNYETVLEYIYAYVNMLKDRGIQEWIYDEVRDLANADYKFKDKKEAISTVLHLSQRLTTYPPEKVLTAYELYEKFDSEAIREVLDCFCPEKSIVILVSKSFEEECKEEDPWYGTKYSQSEINDVDLIARLRGASHPELDLPPKNPYIPKDFSLLTPGTEEFPSKIVSDDFQDVWYLQDNQFADVKVYSEISLYTNDLNYGTSPFTQILTNTWVDIFVDRIREQSYLAQQGGYNYGFAARAQGLMLSTSGYAEHFMNFTDDMIETIANFQITESDQEYFDQMKDKYLNNQKSFFYSEPYSQLSIESGSLLNDKGFYSINDLNEATKAMTFEDLLYFQSRFLRKLRAEMLIMGNITEESAQAISSNFAKVFSDREKLPRHQLTPLRYHQIPSNPNGDSAIAYTRQLDDPDNTNSAVVAIWQYDEFDIEKNAPFLILDNILKEPIFDVLRTKEQLGYVVLKQKWTRRGIMGMEIIIQSAKASPIYLGHRITTFLKTYKEELNQITQETFETHVQAVITRLNKPSLSLYELCKHHHFEIDSARYMFDKKEKLIASLNSVTLQQVKDCYQEVFFGLNRRLDVELVGASHAEAYKEELTQLDRTVYRQVQDFKAETNIHRQVYKRY